MGFIKASETKKPYKIAIGDTDQRQGVFNALRVAKGLTPDTSKICGIESNTGSFAEFSDKMDIAVKQIPANSDWQGYFDAIKEASEVGYQTVIINGLSNEWQNVKSACIGKGQATWLKPKGARQALRLAMLKSRVNIIAIYDLKSISDFPKEAQVKIKDEILLKMGVAFEMEKIDFASFPVMIVRNGSEHFVIRDESGKLAKSFQLTSEIFKGM